MPERITSRGERYPGYDVLAKRNTPSWNDKTRQVIDERLAVPREPSFFTEAEYATVLAIADRIVPQPATRAPIPVAALVDHKLLLDQQDGYRAPGTPRERELWRHGLQALDAEAQAARGAPFRALDATAQDELLRRMQAGDMHAAEWGSIEPKQFFTKRMARDIVLAYYSHPTSWNEVGWGGPASPRGYVRLGYDERDPWEAVEASDGNVEAARRKNLRVG